MTFQKKAVAMKPLLISIGLWLLIFIAVVISIFKDANIYFNATLYMLIITLLITIFGIILQQQNKLGELSARIKSLEGIVSELNDFIFRKLR